LALLMVARSEKPLVWSFVVLVGRTLVFSGKQVMLDLAVELGHLVAQLGMQARLNSAVLLKTETQKASLVFLVHLKGRECRTPRAVVLREIAEQMQHLSSQRGTLSCGHPRVYATPCHLGNLSPIALGT
jgi:hypothetical protein